MMNQRENIKNIWMLTREFAGLAGAGGVKDMVKQLAHALARWNGRSVSVVMPRYGCVQAIEQGFTPLEDPLRPGENLEFLLNMNYALEQRQEAVGVWFRKIGRTSVYLLEAQRFREKADVYTYTPVEEAAEPWKKQGMGHVDYFAMNVLLQKGALVLMQLLGEYPDVIHCHDGHTAILPAMIREIDGFRHYFRNTGVVVTIHNAGTGYHQDVADLPFAQDITGLSEKSILANCLGTDFDPFIAAGRYAVLNTVSENYARELQETADDRLTGWLGHRLLEMGIVLEGVTNGIDPADFDPRLPEQVGIAAGFDPTDDQGIAGKRNCKMAILQKLSGDETLQGVKRFGSLNPDPEPPLFTFIGRLSQQKGVDILIGSIRYMLRQHEGFRIVLLGSGGAWEEDQIIALTRQPGNQGRVCFLRGFSPATANHVYAAGDFFLIPSRYEPCGLTDYIAQLFGNIPIVHHVGGLVKVLDGKTGFGYAHNTREDLVEAIMRALACYDDQQCMRGMQKDAVVRIYKNHTWDKVMKRYLQLYRQSRQNKT
jgi:starch synthase